MTESGKRASTWFLWAVGIPAFIGLAGLLLLGFFRAYPFGVDFSAYYSAAQNITQGQDPYFKGEPPPGAENLFPYLTRYLYPPVSLIWTTPLAWTTINRGIVIWTLASLLLFAFVMIFLSRQARSEKIPTTNIILAFAPWLLCAPLAHHLAVGQADIFVLGLCVLFLWRHEKTPALAGMALAIAIWWKFYPAFFIPLAMALNWRRYARPLAWCMGFGALFGLMGIWLFPDHIWNSWLRVMAFKTEYGNPYIVNQSLVATLQRLFDGRLGRGPLIGHMPDLVMFVSKGAPFFALAAGVALARWIPREKCSNPMILLALFAAVYPLGASYWWVQQFIWLIPVAAWWTLEAGGCERPRKEHLLLALLALIFFVPWLNPTQGIDSPFTFVIFHRFLIGQLLFVWIFIRWALGGNSVES